MGEGRSEPIASLLPSLRDRRCRSPGSACRPVVDHRALLLFMFRPFMFRHGLRSGETCLQKWDAIMADTGTVSITRLKRGVSGVHRLQADELDTLVQLWTRYAESVHVFAGERGRGLTPGAMVSDRPTAIAKIVQRSGALAELL